MIDKYDRKNYNTKLKDISNRMVETYNVMRQASENKFKASMKVGETFHPQSGFYYDEDRNLFKEQCNKLKDEAMKIVSEVTDRLAAQYTKAPTADAVNVVNLVNAIQSKDFINADTIDILLTRYGTDNPMVYNAIREKADSLGYRGEFKKHPIEREIEDVKNLEYQIGKNFYYREMEDSSSVVIQKSALEQAIDSAFPCDSE